jgi:replicative DNA helicase
MSNGASASTKVIKIRQPKVKSELTQPELPPHSKEAEEALLGSILISPDAFGQVAFLKADQFFILRNGWIWEAMQTIQGRRDAIDFLTVIEELRGKGRLDEAGGAAYITYLVSQTATSVYAETYARMIYRMAKRRCMLDVAAEITRLSLDSSLDVVEAHEKAISLLAQISPNTDNNHLREIGEYASDDLDELSEAYFQEKTEAFSTGLADLDKKIGGLEPGRLYLIGGRPGMGKSALVLNIAYYLSKVKKMRVDYFTLEMKASQLRRRLVAMHNGVSVFKQQFPKRGGMSNDEFEAAYQAHATLSNFPLFLNDNSSQTMATIRHNCESLNLITRTPPAVVIIDYRELVTLPSGIDKHSEKERSQWISRECKKLAMSLNTPVLLVVPLNKDVDDRSDKRPTLRDITMAGDYDADVAIGMYRDVYYNADSHTPKQCEAIVLKNRDGATGTAKLFFDAERGYFGNLAEDKK